MGELEGRPVRVELRLTITGRVQGVGFRWFARETARRLGLAGWVGNSADGSVVVEVAGDTGAVDDLVRRLRAGPPHAFVANVHTSSRAGAEPLPEQFAIHREIEP